MPIRKAKAAESQCLWCWRSVALPTCKTGPGSQVHVSTDFSKPGHPVSAPQHQGLQHAHIQPKLCIVTMAASTATQVPTSGIATTPTTTGAAGSSAGWVKLAKDIFAGTCGGISVTLVGHPFDTLKVRLQTQPIDKPIYSGVIDCAKKTIQWEGLGGLYKGVTSPLVGQMFFRASLFGAFGESKRWLAKNADGTTRALKPLDFYKAGAMTGFVAAFTEGPIDFYKSQIQVQIIRSKQNPDYKPPYTSVSQCVKATIRENGLRGPFQGLGATLLRNTPANAVYLGNFEMMKAAYCRKYDCKPTEIPGWVVLSAAGLGGITYWVTIFPVDCIKSAMQTDSIVKGQRKYTDVITTAKLLWGEGGVKRFYRGFTPCLIRAAPANGVMLLTVEKVTAMLNKQ